MHIWQVPAHQRTHALISALDHQDPSQPFHNGTFRFHYICLYKPLPHHHLIQHLDYIMNTTDNWPFAREYSILNATVATLQFWTADLEPNILSNAIE